MQHLPITPQLVDDFAELLEVLGSGTSEYAIDSMISIKRLDKALKKAKASLMAKANEEFEGQSLTLPSGIQVKKKSPQASYTYSDEIQRLEVKLNAMKEAARERGAAKKETQFDPSSHQSFSLVVPFNIHADDEKDLLDAARTLKQSAPDSASCSP